jgi:Cu2+-exporting ATPase
MARVSVADPQVTAVWRDGTADPARFINRLPEQGFEAHPCDAAGPAAAPALPSLLCRLGVAALAALAIRLQPAVMTPDAAGIMQGPPDLVYWLSAAIAVAAAVFAGHPFFIPAVRAAAAGRLSREAPISAAILLALGLSAAEMSNHAVPSYDTGLMLLVAALAVRTLEQAVLQRAPPAASPSARKRP